MAEKIVRKGLEFVRSWTTSTSRTSGICYILDLPPEILQCITEHLNVRDLTALSRTCRRFYTLINDDAFWTHRIRCQFPPSIVELYTSNLFQRPEYVESHDEPRASGFEHTRHESELDATAKNSATHYNDEAIERRHATMYVSREDFRKLVQYFQFKKPKKDLRIPLMKLVYFYLIDRKRQAAVDMNVVHRNDHLTEQADRDSFKGRIIHLRTVCWLEITGRLQHTIMPGKYEVVWRMKCGANGVRMWTDTEFMVVPSHGKLLIYKVSDDEFQTHALTSNRQWFLIEMGHIIIYEPSTVWFAVRNWNDLSWKSGISWDCVELKMIS